MIRKGAIKLAACLVIIMLSVAFFLQTPEVALAETIEVSGPITTDWTWTSDNLYVVIGDVTINSGVTLTIEPGVIVKVKPNLRLIVNGVIKAQGIVTPIVKTTKWEF